MLPMPGWAIIEPEEKKSEGILEIPDSAKTDMQQGTIIEIGNTFYKDGILVSLDLTKGDKVIFKKYHDNDIQVQGKKYKVVHGENIMVKL